jgi:hypothetical protein
MNNGSAAAQADIAAVLRRPRGRYSAERASQLSSSAAGSPGCSGCLAEAAG